MTFMQETVTDNVVIRRPTKRCVVDQTTVRGPVVLGAH